VIAAGAARQPLGARRGRGQAPLAAPRERRDDACGRGGRGGRGARRRAPDLRDREGEALDPRLRRARLRVSGDGKVLVYRTKEGFSRVEAGATAAPKDEEPRARIDLSDWSMAYRPARRVAPDACTRPGGSSARLLLRPGDARLTGTACGAVRPLAARIARATTSRPAGRDVRRALVGHAISLGGDLRRGKRVGVGLLGADLEPDPATGYWRILKIHPRDHPDPEWSSPLGARDLRNRPGQWLVAIDGRPLVPARTTSSGWRPRRQGGRAVDQRAPKARRRAPRRRPPGRRRFAIRYASWIRDTACHVAEKSGGRIGYLHLYDMSGLGPAPVRSRLSPQWRKPALIVDDR